MQHNKIEATQHRIRRILNTPVERCKAHADLELIFTNLGLEVNEATKLCEQIFTFYLAESPLTTIEQQVWSLMQQSVIKLSDAEAVATTLVDAFSNKDTNRLEKNFLQYAPLLKDVSGKVVDYGAGNGRLAQILHDRLHIIIEGVDICARQAAEVTVPIIQFNGLHVPVPDKYYSVGIVNQVLHHEADNEKVLCELNRIVNDKLIIKENIPVGDSEDVMLQNMDRTFILDYLILKLFHNGDTPVPGTFETPSRWKHRFAKYGWKVDFEQDLGFDTPFMPMRRYILAFVRK
jgi:SAM-dependent methyltransferase